MASRSQAGPQWTVTGMLTVRVARPESSKGVNVLAVAGTPFGVPQGRATQKNFCNRPLRPLGEMAARVVKQPKTPIF